MSIVLLLALSDISTAAGWSKKYAHLFKACLIITSMVLILLSYFSMIPVSLFNVFNLKVEEQSLSWSLSNLSSIAIISTLLHELIVISSDGGNKKSLGLNCLSLIMLVVCSSSPLAIIFSSSLLLFYFVSLQLYSGARVVLLSLFSLGIVLLNSLTMTQSSLIVTDEFVSAVVISISIVSIISLFSFGLQKIPRERGTLGALGFTFIFALGMSVHLYGLTDVQKQIFIWGTLVFSLVNFFYQLLPEVKEESVNVIALMAFASIAVGQSSIAIILVLLFFMQKMIKQVLLGSLSSLLQRYLKASLCLMPGTPSFFLALLALMKLHSEGMTSIGLLLLLYTLLEVRELVLFRGEALNE